MLRAGQSAKQRPVTTPSWLSIAIVYPLQWGRETESRQVSAPSLVVPLSPTKKMTVCQLVRLCRLSSMITSQLSSTRQKRLNRPPVTVSAMTLVVMERRLACNCHRRQQQQIYLFLDPSMIDVCRSLGRHSLKLTLPPPMRRTAPKPISVSHTLTGPECHQTYVLYI